MTTNPKPSEFCPKCGKQYINLLDQAELGDGSQMCMQCASKVKENQKASEAKPLPCPFCGSTDIALEIMHAEWVFMTCLECECSGPWADYENAAIAAWNRRYNPMLQIDENGVISEIRPVAQEPEQEYRMLEEGEIVLESDEYLDDVKGWIKPQGSIGDPAPNPNYTSHRKFRRRKEPEQGDVSAEMALEWFINEQICRGYFNFHMSIAADPHPFKIIERFDLHTRVVSMGKTPLLAIRAAMSAEAKGKM